MTTASPRRDRTIRQSLGVQPQVTVRRFRVQWALSRAACRAAFPVCSFEAGDEPVLLELTADTRADGLFATSARLIDRATGEHRLGEGAGVRSGSVLDD